MAIKKIQMRPKGISGTYADTLYPETSADMVYANSGQTLEQLIATFLTTASKGAASGLAPLDAASKIPSAYMPSDSNIESRTSDPGTPINGRIWLRTDL